MLDIHIACFVLPYSVERLSYHTLCRLKDTCNVSQGLFRAYFYAVVFTVSALPAAASSPLLSLLVVAAEIVVAPKAASLLFASLDSGALKF